MQTQQDTTEQPIKRTVFDYEELCEMLPFFKGKRKLADILFRLTALDKVNWIHDRNCDTPGVPFTRGLLNDLNIKQRIDNEDILDRFAGQPFITVSNHPLGGLDGIMLIKMVGEHRPDFKVMVNMILAHIGAMRPNFIKVDALASNDPAKRAESVKGITEALRHVKQGHPLGFFPAGAVSKIQKNLRIEDRPWQPSVIRIIQKLNVPVIPIYFHDRNSWIFNLFGLIDWRLRSMRMAVEVFRRKNHTFHISIGEPITPEEMSQYPSVEELGEYLKTQTYAMRKWK